MRTFNRFMLLVAALLNASHLCAAEPATKFPLQDGDIWVMAGDSITAQHLHSNYFEAFCFARYPEWKFAFRNSGVGGHTIPSTLARFEYDIAAWKPTVVSVELGMNDKGGTPTDKFIANMKSMLERIRGIKARPVILSASPINNGETMATLGGGNQRLHEYADALKKLAAEEKVPYADQFHALLDTWGKNKPYENLATSLPILQRLADDKKVQGAEHLKQFLAAQQQVTEKPVVLQGDPVHPGAPGQLMMAIVLLRDLGADGEVSSATLDATGKLVESKRCEITNIKRVESTVAFDRLDERLPMPIPDDARSGLRLDPTLLEMSRYMLTVIGLPQGQYTLKIDDVIAGTVSAKELEAGLNLTSLGAADKAPVVSPILVQSRAILAAVSAKEGAVGQWRGLSQKAHGPDGTPVMKTELAALTTKVEEADAKIREAAKPKKMRFLIEPAR